MTKKLLHIVGCPRTGTSAMFRLLNEDSRFLILYENKLPQIVGGFGSLLSGANSTPPHGFDSSERRAKEWHYINIHMTKAEDYLKTTDFVFSEVAKRVGKDYDGVMFIGDKTPSSVYELHNLVKYNQRAICLIRDPYSTINSMRIRAYNTLRGLDSWHIFSPYDMCQVWSDAVRQADACAEVENCLIVDFKKLYVDFDAEKVRIGNFFGLSRVESNYEIGTPHIQPTLNGEIIAIIDKMCNLDAYKSAYSKTYGSEPDLEGVTEQYLTDRPADPLARA